MRSMKMYDAMKRDCNCECTVVITLSTVYSSQAEGLRNENS
jgi:hypothetical protein